MFFLTYEVEQLWMNYATLVCNGQEYLLDFADEGWTWQDILLYLATTLMIFQAPLVWLFSSSYSQLGEVSIESALFSKDRETVFSHLQGLEVIDSREVENILYEHLRKTYSRPMILVIYYIGRPSEQQYRETFDTFRTRKNKEQSVQL